MELEIGLAMFEIAIIIRNRDQIIIQPTNRYP